MGLSGMNSPKQLSSCWGSSSKCSDRVVCLFVFIFKYPCFFAFILSSPCNVAGKTLAVVLIKKARNIVLRTA